MLTQIFWYSRISTHILQFYYQCLVYKNRISLSLSLSLSTTYGPRDLSLWSFKKYRRKIQIQMNSVSHLIRKSQSLEMTHGNRLSPFMEFITLSIYRLSILLSPTKEGLKALWTWCFPRTSGAAPITLPPCQGPPEFITEDQITQPFHIFIMFLIVLPTHSLHIEMVTYCTSKPIIQRAELHISILPLKYATKRSLVRFPAIS